MEWYERIPDRPPRSERDFKVCDFCGALNPVVNADCFVCNWRGQFRTDRETVGEAMRSLESEAGGLGETLFAEEVVPSSLPRPGFWANLRSAVGKLFRRA